MSNLIHFEQERAFHSEDGPAKLDVASPVFSWERYLHAAAIFVLPVIAVPVAIWLAVRDGFGWLELGTFFVMYCVAWVGITVGYHRFFSHHSFVAPNPIRLMLGIFGSIAAQGPINYWVANHRRHHKYADRDGDIHSPYVHQGRQMGTAEGFLQSHVLWTFNHVVSNPAVMCREVLRDPLLQFVNRNYYVWLALGFVAPALVGGLVTMTWLGAFKGLLWGGFVRLFTTYHCINAITSLAHMWGYQEYNSRDQSRNNGLMAILTWGESWHNNHHSFPSSAFFGLKWWQVDFGAYFIRTLHVLGLARELRRPHPALLDKKRLAR